MGLGNGVVAVCVRAKVVKDEAQRRRKCRGRETGWLEGGREVVEIGGDNPLFYGWH